MRRRAARVQAPRHLLGISEPDDIFVGIENGVDTFGLRLPTRVARNAAVYPHRPFPNVTNARFKADFSPSTRAATATPAPTTPAPTCVISSSRRCLAATLASIHNERFIVRMVDDAREAIKDGTYFEYRDEFLGNYYPARNPKPVETRRPHSPRPH